MTRLCLVVVALGSAMSQPSMLAQSDLEKLWRDELRLTFVMQSTSEPETFGVGAIVSGRGRGLLPDCYTHICFPDKSKLIKDGTIRITPYPRGPLKRMRASAGVLNVWKVGYTNNRVRSVEIEFEDAFQEEIDLPTATMIYNEHLSQEGRKLLYYRRKPPGELVILAVRCKEMRFKLFDKAGRALSLPTSKPAGAIWARNEEFTGSFKNVWFGIRTAIKRPLPPASTEPGKDSDWKRPLPMHDPADIPGATEKPAKTPEFTLKETKPRLGLIMLDLRGVR